ncbi:MAG: hypothetical protein IJV39_00500 [Ruminococcus sp.]|nr:hypothetical protein [Ruminococcus sp.]
MSKMIFTLVKLNLHSMLYSMFTFLGGRNKDDKSRNSVMHIVIICAVVVFLIVIFVFFFSIFLGISMFTYPQKFRVLYPSIALMSATFFAFLGTVLSAQSYLFEAKDNEHLLSMPIKPVHILISRFATLYVLNLFYSGMILLPSFLVYIFFSRFDWLSIVVYFLGMLCFPILLTAVCSLIGFFFYFISSKFPNKKIGNVTLGIVFFGIIVMLFMFARPMLEHAVENLEFAKYLLYKYFYPFYMFGIAVTNHNVIFLLVIVFVCVLSAVLVCMLISAKYVKIITSHKDKRKKVYVEKPMKVRSPMTAIIIKEFRYFISSPGYVMNASLGTIFSIIFGIYLINNGYEFSGMVTDYVTNINSLVPLVVLSSLTLMSVMNDSTAPSISLEAKTLWMLKTMPVDCTKILFAKSLLSPVISLPGAIIMTVCSVIAIPMNAVDVIAMIVIPVIAAFFSGLLGVCMNLIFPRFDWTSEIIVIKQSASVVITLFSSVFVALFPFVFAILLPAMLDDFAIFWSYIMLLGYFLLLIAVEMIFLKTKGKELFKRL